MINKTPKHPITLIGELKINLDRNNVNAHVELMIATVYPIFLEILKECVITNREINPNSPANNDDIPAYLLFGKNIIFFKEGTPSVILFRGYFDITIIRIDKQIT